MTTKLEVRLADKTLSVDGELMKLDGSLFDAEDLEVLKDEDEKVLELRYKTQGEDFYCNEAENIYDFLEQRGLSDDYIQVSFCPDFVPTTVSLVGEFNATIYR